MSLISAAVDDFVQDPSASKRRIKQGDDEEGCGDSDGAKPPAKKKRRGKRDRCSRNTEAEAADAPEDSKDVESNEEKPKASPKGTKSRRGGRKRRDKEDGDKPKTPIGAWGRRLRLEVNQYTEKTCKKGGACRISPRTLDRFKLEIRLLEEVFTIVEDIDELKDASAARIARFRNGNFAYTPADEQATAKIEQVQSVMSRFETHSNVVPKSVIDNIKKPLNDLANIYQEMDDILREHRRLQDERDRVAIRIAVQDAQARRCFAES